MMKRLDIRHAYDNILLDQESKDRMLAAILAAASETAPSGKEYEMKRINWKKTWMIAAAVSVMMLLMGCAVVLFTLQDMQIGEYTHIVPKYTDEEGNKIKDFEIKKDVISLQGIKGSPSQMAAQEWYEFESNYDKDYKRLEEADKNPIEVSREYDAYFVYTQDMVDKIDEISAKYGLKLAGPIAGVQRENPEIFYESLGIPSFLYDAAAASMQFCGGYFYECGNFKAEFELLLTGAEVTWTYPIHGSIQYCGKEYLDTVFAHISGVENFEQWTHELSDGQEVLIASGDEHALILCDTKDAFVSVLLQTMHCDEGNNLTHMSKQDVEFVADAIDFTIVPQKPDMAEADRRIEEAYAKEKAEKKAAMAEYKDPFAPKSSYEEKIQALLQNGVDSNSYFYALYDVNMDGIDDLLLSSETDSIGPIYTIYKEETYGLLSFGLDKYSYLCENGIILHNDLDGNPNGYYFYQIDKITGDGMEAKCIDAIFYDEWEESWIRTLNGMDNKITEQEAMTIIESYGRVELDMKPISSFSM